MSYIFKMNLLAMFGKLTIALLESSLWFETAMSFALPIVCFSGVFLHF